MQNLKKENVVGGVRQELHVSSLPFVTSDLFKIKKNC